MATQTTAIAIGEREDLSDIISRIDPSETPIYSALSKETVRNTVFDWLVQELASAASNNYVAEGADASFATPTQAVRFSNVTQISQKDAAVSGTLDSVDTAGRDRESAYQKVLKGLELRRDMEKMLVVDNAKATGATRETAALSSWITNVSVGGGSGAAPTGDGSDVPTGGTDRALTLALIDAAHQAAYEDGGNPSLLVLSPSKKAAFSDLSSGSVATNQIQYTAPREAAIVGSVSLYLSDYGELSVVIDRQIGNDRIYLLDSDYASIVPLPGRDFAVTDLAKTGDASKFQIITEFGLKVSAPKAHAAVYDLS